MTDLTAQRRFYAEEIQVTANLTSSALVDALATVARLCLPRSPPAVVAHCAR